MSKVLRPPYSMHVFWSNQDEAYIAVSPELDDLSAFGATAQEAASELNVAIDAVLDVLQQDNEPLPAAVLAPSHSGQFPVRLPKSLHSRLAAEADREGISLNALVVARLSASDAAEAAVRKVLADFTEPSSGGRAERRAAHACTPLRTLVAAAATSNIGQVPAPQGTRFAVQTATE